MDLDQLKLLLDTLNAAGAGAKETAIFWMLSDLVKGPLMAASVFGGLAFVSVRAIGAISPIATRTAALVRMRDILWPNEIGTNLSDSEIRGIERTLRDYVKNKSPNT